MSCSHLPDLREIGRQAIRAVPLSSSFFWQTLLLAIDQLRVHKMRSLLTTLGIVIGVASVIGVVAGLTGLKNKVLTEFESFGVNNVYVSHKRPIGSTEEAYPFESIRIKESELAAMQRNVRGLRAITPIAGVPDPVVETGSAQIRGATVSGIWSDWHDLEGRQVVEGRVFNAIDEREGRQVCLVNSHAIEELMIKGSPLGIPVLMDGRRFIIVGVVDDRQSGMFEALLGGSGTRAELYVPFSAARKLAGESLYLFVVGRAQSTAMSEQAADSIRVLLRKMRQIRDGSPDTFEVQKLDKYVAQFDALALAITSIAGAIVGISLLVGGIGIMNIMLVAVSERKREIGLRKAVGASSSAVLVQFLLEAVVLCLFGGVIGAAVGYLIALGLVLMPWTGLHEATVPAWVVLSSLGFSATIGVVFGMFPALKAARLDPIEALRTQ